MNLRLDIAPMDLIFHSIKEQGPPQEPKEFRLNLSRDIRLEVDQVEIGLVVDLFAVRGRTRVIQRRGDGGGQVRDGEGIGWVGGIFDVDF